MAVVCRVDRRLRPGAAGRRGAAHPAGGQAKALEALAVGNLAPGRELDTWKFSSLARNFFGGGWW